MRKICGSFTVIILFSTLTFGAEIDQAKFKLAEKQFNRKDYASAAVSFKELAQNYPFSVFYPKSLYFAAKSSLEIKDYDSAVRYFALAEKKSQKDTDRRLALFGLGESQYRSGKWKDAALSFMNFGIRYKDSPAAPAALNYSALSLETMNLQAEARSVYQTILSLYPESPYAAVARTKLGLIESSSKRTNEIDISNNALDVIDLNENIRNMTNLIIITNSVFQTNSQFVQPMINPNPIFLDSTNFIEISNQVVITQKVMMLDTNELILQKEYQENQKKEEEIERFRSLIELKAKLLEIKEKALEEKKKEIMENPDEGPANE